MRRYLHTGWMEMLQYGGQVCACITHKVASSSNKQNIFSSYSNSYCRRPSTTKTAEDFSPPPLQGTMIFGYLLICSFTKEPFTLTVLCVCALDMHLSLFLLEQWSSSHHLQEITSRWECWQIFSIFFLFLELFFFYNKSFCQVWG